MNVAVIGAGPAGLFVGAALARRGHRVTAVDRDIGPGGGGEWARRGVMQFHHAHTFRPQVADALLAEMPLAYKCWLDAGAEPVTATFDGRDRMIGVRSRRVTFERALRSAAVQVDGLQIRRGHVDGILTRNGRAAGVQVDGVAFDADLVIDCSGRAGRAARGLGGRRTVGGNCGIAYVDRQYRLRPGALPGPMSNPIGYMAGYDGYMVLVFPHEYRLFSTVIIRSTANRDLIALRHAAAFDAVARAIPALAEWTDPAIAEPVTSVLPGGALMNVYRGQSDEDGQLILPGLIFLGDAVCTTTPNFGRGLTTTMMQCTELLALLDAGPWHLDDVGEQFDRWCDAAMLPWVQDHMTIDDAQADRWNGHAVDLSKALPSDLIVEAAAVDATIGARIGPYLSMQQGPDSLAALESRAHAVFAGGWSPAPPPGPTAAQLSEIVTIALASP